MKNRKAELEELIAKLDAIATVTPWRAPSTLSLEYPAPQVDSAEISTQTSRNLTVQHAAYASLEDIPSNPKQLSDLENTLQLSLVASSAPIGKFPFFVNKENISEQAGPTSSIDLTVNNPDKNNGQTNYQVQPVVLGATPEQVRSLGLPLFLVGSNLHALQTLVASPGLMGTFVDAQGRIDQVRLINMVKVLSEQSTNQPQMQTHYQQPTQYQPMAMQTGMYMGNQPTAYYGQVPPKPTMNNFYQNGFQQQATVPQSSNFDPYGSQASSYRPKNYRGEHNNDGNLHISGYGYGTSESDIINLFMPYVKVDEVVMKSTFSFANTSDPVGARNAMQALNGKILGGKPIKISQATRRAPDPSRRFEARANAVPTFTPSTAAKPQLPITATGEVDVNAVSKLVFYCFPPVNLL